MKKRLKENKTKIENNKIKESKTYSIGSLFIVIILFVIIISVFTFIRNMKSDEILMELSRLDKEIEKLEKEVKVLNSEEVKLSSPNRFIETAIINGFSSAASDNDIIYLKIKSN
ncbi:septation ring formation regulator EzrA [uncultured Brachyspira sp.]|jgi:septum formation initiator|uniref:septation ring formation regulator EzrA n=1 Tax=uncultured Brachyspira sp. TaxID=221953 RepID=UPI0032091A55